MGIAIFTDRYDMWDQHVSGFLEGGEIPIAVVLSKKNGELSSIYLFFLMWLRLKLPNVA